MKKKPFNTEGTDISKTYELKQQVGPALKKECLHDQKCITQEHRIKKKKSKSTQLVEKITVTVQNTTKCSGNVVEIGTW